MENHKTLFKKILQLKSEIGKISKDSENPFFKSRYFDINALLENVEPLIQKHGLVLLQPILDGSVSTRIIDSESGEEIKSEIKLPEQNDPQKLGSAITYYRRYTLQSLLGIQAEDDDGNKASGYKTQSQNTNQNTSNKDNKPWLNLFDKQGNPTKTYADMELAVSGEHSYTLKGIRNKYKVSKRTASQLEKEFGIK